MTKPDGLSLEEIMDKIAKLLAKAESTTPEEAEAITEHVVRLMTKYSIDVAVLNARRAAAGEKVEEKIIRKSFTFTGTYHRALLYTFNDIARALGFMVSFTRGSNYSSMKIMGYESDIENGVLLITSLQLQLTSALTAWWKAYDGKRYMSAMMKFKARRSFMYAFADGVSERVMSRRHRLIAEAEAESPGATLAVRDRQTELARAYEALGVKMVKIKTDITDYSAYENGLEAGRNADTGNDQVHGSDTLMIES
jgi:hypothetical protein